ncbi:MAG UNVERIFIED_CONTAM: M23 family metallopeptidase [Rickettsiaceae bacterium]|jgi:murein DD-endopeptidase MepM/ murein hydrolase activator NlpD
MDKTRFIEISRVGENFIAKDVVIPLKKVLVRSSTIVKNSFIEAAASLGISKANVIDLVNTYSHQIDFQRQIHKNDQLDLVLEKYIDEKGEFSHYGKVVYASLTLSGKPHHIYRYAHEGQNMQYFSEDGKSVKRNLLSTPISAARLSSHYGKRKHPILGYTKMHKGVDFAASTGTPIYAAGNGVISEIGWKNGYGNYVQIRHSGTLSTAYGHASRFASGLKRGTVVKQGQTIAFVGATGRATGPHLHYEVKINGRQVNPLSIKTSPGIELHGKKLAAFTAYKKKIHKIHKDLHTKGELHINDKLLDS